MKLNEAEVTSAHLIYFDPAKYIQKVFLPRHINCCHCGASLTIDMESDFSAAWYKGSYTYTKGNWRLNLTCLLCGKTSSLREPEEKYIYSSYGQEEQESIRRHNEVVKNYPLVVEHYKSKLSPYYVWSREHWEIHNVLLGLFSVIFLGLVIPLLIFPSMTLAIWTAVVAFPEYKLVQHSFAPETRTRLTKPAKELVYRRLHAGETGQMKALKG